MSNSDVQAGLHTPLFDFATSACALLESTIAFTASYSSAAGLLISCGLSISTPTSTTCNRHVQQQGQGYSGQAITALDAAACCGML
jgi:hypothetical protein